MIGLVMFTTQLIGFPTGSRSLDTVYWLLQCKKPLTCRKLIDLPILILGIESLWQAQVESRTTVGPWQ